MILGKARQIFLRKSILALMLGSCFGGQEQLREVIERSRRNVPEWVNWQPKKTRRESDALLFVLQKKGALNLPLALKQTEQSLNVNLTAYCFELVWRQISLEGLDNEALTEKESRFLKKYLSEVMNQESFDGHHLRDYYFEEVLIGERQRVRQFNIYALIAFQYETLTRIYQNWLQALSRSPETNIRRISRVLEKKRFFFAD